MILTSSNLKIGARDEGLETRGKIFSFRDWEEEKSAFFSSLVPSPQSLVPS